MRNSPQKRVVRVRIDAIVREIGRDLGVDTWTVKYCLRRFRSEGLQFLTKTLPQLSKCLLRSLEVGYFAIRPEAEIDYEGLTCFRWKGRSLCIMQSLLQRIFDRHGLLREDADPNAIRAIRQFCEYLYKLSTEFDADALSDAEAGFVRVEEEISRFVDTPLWVELIRKNAHALFPSVMDLTIDQLLKKAGPRDGPGSFAGANPGWHLRKQLPGKEIGHLQRHFNAIKGYFKSYPSSGSRASIFGPERLRSVPTDKVSEVLFVPKDSRGPRTISREPLHLLKVQMAFFDYMSGALEKDSKCRINFENQQINRDLAREGSITGEHATLDLKEASDRIRLSLCRRVFKHAPAVRWFIEHARSTHCRLPSGDVLELSKLGNMGNGLTFPLLAMVTYLSAVTAVVQFKRLPIKEVARRIYVYGDDVICPTEWVSIVDLGLAFSGLKVNKAKSFSQGSFRESCGGDYFNGVDVTPVRLRLSGAKLKDASAYKLTAPMVLEDHGILQLERHCRELRKAGLFCLSDYYYRQMEKVIPLPPVSGTSCVLGRWDAKIFDVIDDIEAIVPAPNQDDSIHVCPHKYLGRFLKSIDDALNVATFGVVPVPRSVKLQKKVVVHHERHGIESIDPTEFIFQRTPVFSEMFTLERAIKLRYKAQTDALVSVFSNMMQSIYVVWGESGESPEREHSTECPDSSTRVG